MGTRPPHRVLRFGHAPSAGGRVLGFGVRGSGEDAAPGIRLLRRLPPALIPLLLMAGAIAVLIVALNAGRGSGVGLPPDFFAAEPPAGATIGLDAPVPAGRVYLLEHLRAPDPVAAVRAALRRDGWRPAGRGLWLPGRGLDVAVFAGAPAPGLPRVPALSALPALVRGQPAGSVAVLVLRHADG